MPRFNVRSRREGGGDVNDSTATESAKHCLENLMEQLSCPICDELLSPPIMQCNNGHVICNDCKPRIPNNLCPTCRAKLDNYRNLALENVANNILFPCKFAPDGCTVTGIKFSEKADHEKICDFSSYGCPCVDTPCDWRGQASEVMAHLKNQHRNVVVLEGNDVEFLVVDINLPGNIDWVMVQSCYNQHFVLVVQKYELDDGSVRFSAIAQLIGPRTEAENFKYNMELTGSDESSLVTPTENTRSIQGGVGCRNVTPHCFFFTSEDAQRFADDGNLSISVRVSQQSN